MTPRGLGLGEHLLPVRHPGGCDGLDILRSHSVCPISRRYSHHFPSHEAVAGREISQGQSVPEGRICVSCAPFVTGVSGVPPWYFPCSSPVKCSGGLSSRTSLLPGVSPGSVFSRPLYVTPHLPRLSNGPVITVHSAPRYDLLLPFPRCSAPFCHSSSGTMMGWLRSTGARSPVCV